MLSHCANMILSLGLWGRSMGAVSALMLASRLDKFQVLVLDSPFSDFSQVVDDSSSRHKVRTLTT